MINGLYNFWMMDLYCSAPYRTLLVSFAGRVRALTDGSVHHDRKDPIFNFLFEYYHFKPRILLQWTPGIEVYLLDADPTLKGMIIFCFLVQDCLNSVLTVGVAEHRSFLQNGANDSN